MPISRLIHWRRGQFFFLIIYLLRHTGKSWSPFVSFSLLIQPIWARRLTIVIFFKFTVILLQLHTHTSSLLLRSVCKVSACWIATIYCSNKVASSDSPP